MDDITLIQFLVQSPSFKDTVEISETHITAYFSDRDEPVAPEFLEQLKNTDRGWDLKGHAIVFARPGAILVNHFITIKPRRVNLLEVVRANIMNFKFKPLTR